MKRISPLFIVLLLTSCIEHFEEREIYGYYTPIDYKNSFDTIQLLPDGVYHRKVYDRNKKLLLEMNGKWTLKDNENLQFDPFYLNLDDDLVKFPEQVKDTTGGWAGNLEANNGKIQFCVGYYAPKLSNQNCYCKLNQNY